MGSPPFFYPQWAEGKNQLMKTLYAVILIMTSTSTMAHPVFENSTAQAGVVFKAELMITHGCGNSPTVKVIVDVPEDVLKITPQIKDGWSIETKESKLDTPREVFGMTRTKYTSQIIWSGGSVPIDYFDVFSFIVIPPANAATLYFPTTQVCEEGKDRYTTIPDAESAGEHIPGGAPSVLVVEAADVSGH